MNELLYIRVNSNTFFIKIASHHPYHSGLVDYCIKYKHAYHTNLLSKWYRTHLWIPLERIHFFCYFFFCCLFVVCSWNIKTRLREQADHSTKTDNFIWYKFIHSIKLNKSIMLEGNVLNVSSTFDLSVP